MYVGRLNATDVLSQALAYVQSYTTALMRTHTLNHQQPRDAIWGRHDRDWNKSTIPIDCCEFMYASQLLLKCPLNRLPPAFHQTPPLRIIDWNSRVEERKTLVLLSGTRIGILMNNQTSDKVNKLDNFHLRDSDPRTGFR